HHRPPDDDDICRHLHFPALPRLDRPDASTYDRCGDKDNPWARPHPRAHVAGVCGMTGTPVLALLAQIAEAQSIDAVWRLAKDYFASLGFSQINYGFTRFKHMKTIGDPDDALFLTTGDEAYAQRYSRCGSYPPSPRSRRAETDTRACTLHG